MMEKQLLKTKATLQKTVFDLERQRKTFNSINLSILPDKGAKLKQSILNLEEKFESLTLQLKEESNIIKGQIQKTCDKVPSKAVAVNKTEDMKKDDNVLNYKKPVNPNTNYCDRNDSETTDSSKQFNFRTPSKEITSFHELCEGNDSKPFAVDRNVDSPSFKNWREPSIKLTEAKPLPALYGQKQYRQNSYATTNFKSEVSEEAINRLQHSLSVYPEDSEMENPPDKLNISLMPHQIKALSWLIWREAQIPSGGILADDMGLGKTLTMIALILKQKEKNNFADISNEKFISNIMKGTLIVCLASIIHQWAEEINNRCEKNALKVFIYHGPKRQKDIDFMKKHDVVLTTYDILLSERKSLLTKEQKSGLFELKWERVILDEAHTIKNSSSKKAEAVFSLQSYKKWCVTGTPIHNDFKDLYSLIKFLQFSPFDNSEKFKKLTNSETKSSDERRNMLIKSILLRRTKDDMNASGKPLIEMKNKSMIICEIELCQDERKIYDELHEKVNNIMKRYFNEPRKRFQNSSSLLVLLLRLQQCCNHTSLLKGALEETVNDSLSDISVSLSTLAIDGQSDCSSGSDSLLNLSFSEYEKISIFDRSVKSTKIQRLFDKLSKIASESNDSSKSVIVSQWVDMLELVEQHLKQDKIPYHKIIGSTKPEERQIMSEDFNYNPDGAKIMLLSLKAGGVGLNLIGANHLFLLDLHWNPALENQACDRIHRVGQKKDVFIHKFVCKGTIEEDILRIQKKKSTLACDVLHGAGKAKTGLSIDDFRELFDIRL